MTGFEPAPAPAPSGQLRPDLNSGALPGPTSSHEHLGSRLLCNQKEPVDILEQLEPVGSEQVGSESELKDIPAFEFAHGCLSQSPKLLAVLPTSLVTCWREY